MTAGALLGRVRLYAAVDFVVAFIVFVDSDRQLLSKLSTLMSSYKLFQIEVIKWEHMRDLATFLSE